MYTPMGGPVGPASGVQACGETGAGRMLEAHELVEDLVAFFQPKLLAERDAQHAR